MSDGRFGPDQRPTRDSAGPDYQGDHNLDFVAGNSRVLARK
jgi:hypothetical protein